MRVGTEETLNSDYEKLLARAKDIVILRSVNEVIGWDMQTKMPPKGIGLRGEQSALLSRFFHKMNTDPEVSTLLEKIERHPDYPSLSELQRRNVYLVRKNYDEQTKLPEKLVAETARQTAIAFGIWKKAKAAKDYSLFKPELAKVIDLIKQTAAILMEVKKTATPYDALIDIFEPKMTASQITPIFNELKTHLIKIIDKCTNSSKQPDPSILRRKVPISAQEEISKSLAKFIEYDAESKNAGGRIDEAEHPFTAGYFDDVRITTHYYEDDVTSSLFSVLHEGGHALYEQGFSPEWMYLPVGSSASAGFHESQSRLVENMIGRSSEFWTSYYSQFKALTGSTFSDIPLDAFVHAINRVQPSKIRVEADEVTYSLHVIIRFEIEQALFQDKVTVDELPSVWNQKYMDYLGQKIENDSEGVMQDIHWAGGGFGYFPSYALGNMYGGQIFAAFAKDVPNWASQLEKGDFHNIRQWLTTNVFSHGNLYDPIPLLKKITGQEINVKPFIDYLNTKFSKIYEY